MAHGATLPLALLALGSVSYWLAQRSAPVAAPVTAEAPASAPTPTPEAPATPVSAPVTKVVPQAAPADRSRQLELPDGTFVPTLNGAVDAEPLKNYWGVWPWSPIVGVERSSAGVDWYQHADGSYSTTQMLRADPGNRLVTLTRVAHPSTTTAPTAPEAGR